MRTRQLLLQSFRKILREKELKDLKDKTRNKLMASDSRPRLTEQHMIQQPQTDQSFDNSNSQQNAQNVRKIAQVLFNLQTAEPVTLSRGSLKSEVAAFIKHIQKMHNEIGVLTDRLTLADLAHVLEILQILLETSNSEKQIAWCLQILSMCFFRSCQNIIKRAFDEQQTMLIERKLLEVWQGTNKIMKILLSAQCPVSCHIQLLNFVHYKIQFLFNYGLIANPTILQANIDLIRSIFNKSPIDLNKLNEKLIISVLLLIDKVPVQTLINLRLVEEAFLWNFIKEFAGTQFNMNSIALFLQLVVQSSQIILYNHKQQEASLLSYISSVIKKSIKFYYDSSQYRSKKQLTQTILLSILNIPADIDITFVSEFCLKVLMENDFKDRQLDSLALKALSNRFQPEKNIAQKVSAILAQRLLLNTIGSQFEEWLIYFQNKAQAILDEGRMPDE